MSTYRKTYFTIRFKVRSFHDQSAEIEAFGQEHGKENPDYLYLLNLAQQYKEIAQAA